MTSQPSSLKAYSHDVHADGSHLMTAASITPFNGVVTPQRENKQRQTKRDTYTGRPRRAKRAAQLAKVVTLRLWCTNWQGRCNRHPRRSRRLRRRCRRSPGPQSYRSASRNCSRLPRTRRIHRPTRLSRPDRPSGTMPTMTSVMVWVVFLLFFWGGVSGHERVRACEGYCWGRPHDLAVGARRRFPFVDGCSSLTLATHRK